MQRKRGSRPEDRPTAPYPSPAQRPVDWVDEDERRLAPSERPAQRPVSYVPAQPKHAEMSSMSGATPLDALTRSTGVHLVELQASYADRADGFVRSTIPLWLAVSGSAAGLVLVAWLVGPLAGRWAFALGWWIASELGVLAVTSVCVWAAMWWRWHRDGPDAIASRSADARLRMAEKWFDKELGRVYPEDK